MTLNVRRTVESGHVRQSFSHGRSKSVLVEKKKRRAVGATPAAQPVEEQEAEGRDADGTPEPQRARERDDASAAPGRGAARALRRGEGRAHEGAARIARQREADEREKRQARNRSSRVVTEEQRVKEPRGTRRAAERKEGGCAPRGGGQGAQAARKTARKHLVLRKRRRRLPAPRTHVIQEGAPGQAARRRGAPRSRPAHDHQRARRGAAPAEPCLAEAPPERQKKQMPAAGAGQDSARSHRSPRSSPSRNSPTAWPSAASTSSSS